MHDICHIGQQRLPIDPLRQIRQAGDLNGLGKTDGVRVSGRGHNPIASARKRGDEPPSDKA
jgi:hypothetical protein